MKKEYKIKKITSETGHVTFTPCVIYHSRFGWIGDLVLELFNERVKYISFYGSEFGFIECAEKFDSAVHATKSIEAHKKRTKRKEEWLDYNSQSL